MKQKLSSFLAAAMVMCVLLLNACSEDNPTDSTDNTRTGMLSRTWEIESYGVDGSTTEIHKGTLQVFTKAGSFTWKRADGSEINSGTWEFQENETRLKLPFATVTIDSLTSSVLRYSTAISGGTATFRLKAK